MLLGQNFIVFFVLAYWMASIHLVQKYSRGFFLIAIKRLNKWGFLGVLMLFAGSFFSYWLGCNESQLFSNWMFCPLAAILDIAGIVLFVLYAWKGGGVTLAAPFVIAFKRNPSEELEKMWNSLTG
jgi:hypothetical protein